MLFVGDLRIDRSRDPEYWACLWQGANKPSDINVLGAFRLLTDQRIIAFEAQSIEAVQFFDRFNLVARWSVHPSLDQTRGYAAALNNDVEDLGAMLRERGLPRSFVDTVKRDRQRMIDAPTVNAAMQIAADIEWY